MHFPLSCGCRINNRAGESTQIFKDTCPAPVAQCIFRPAGDRQCPGKDSVPLGCSMGFIFHHSDGSGLIPTRGTASTQHSPVLSQLSDNVKLAQLLAVSHFTAEESQPSLSCAQGLVTAAFP